MLLDPSAGSQSYIEDCEVCCRPIKITYEVVDDRIQSVVAEQS